MSKDGRTILSMLFIKKSLLFLSLLTTIGCPFIIFHTTASFHIINKSVFVLWVLIYLTHIKELSQIKLSWVSIFGLFLAIFGLIRPEISPPPQHEIYDLWLITLGVTISLKECQLKSLLRFSTILLSPITFFTISQGILPPIQYGSLLVLGGCLLGVIFPPYQGKTTKKPLLITSILALTGFSLYFFHLLLFDPGIEKKGVVAFDIGHGSIQSPTFTYDRDLSKSQTFGHAKFFQFTRDLGYNPILLDGAIDSNKLKDKDILVVIMSSKIYTPEEVRCIHEWIASGGGLLVIGDHTNLSQTMSSLNPIISPLGIRIVFDTIWLSDSSRKNILYSRHPLVWDIDEVFLSVGASLQLKGQAKPVMVASYSDFSDWGNPDNVNEAYLGNNKLDPKEQIGNIVLSATSNYGKGRIVVLGDSAYFQNTSIYGNYLFGKRILDFLNRKNSSLNNSLLYLSLIILIVLIIYIIQTQFTTLQAIPISVGFSIVTAILVSSWINIRIYPAMEITKVGSKRILFDFSHHPEYKDYWTTRMNSQDGIDSLIHQAIRIGYYPVIKKRGKVSLEELKQYNIYITIAPNKGYSPSEMEAIIEYVKTGGSILMADGARKWNVLNPLLEKFDIQIDKNYPLGMDSPVIKDGLIIQIPYGNFISTRVDSKHPIINGISNIRFVNPTKIKGGNPCAWINDNAVLCYKKYGQGRIVVVSDDKFFSNYVTEDETGVKDEEKLRLIWNILDYLGEIR